MGIGSGRARPSSMVDSRPRAGQEPFLAPAVAPAHVSNCPSPDRQPGRRSRYKRTSCARPTLVDATLQPVPDQLLGSLPHPRGNSDTHRMVASCQLPAAFRTDWARTGTEGRATYQPPDPPYWGKGGRALSKGGKLAPFPLVRGQGSSSQAPTAVGTAVTRSAS